MLAEAAAGVLVPPAAEAGAEARAAPLRQQAQQQERLLLEGAPLRRRAQLLLGEPHPHHLKTGLVQSALPKKTPNESQEPN